MLLGNNLEYIYFYIKELRISLIFITIKRYRFVASTWPSLEYMLNHIWKIKNKEIKATIFCVC